MHFFLKMIRELSNHKNSLIAAWSIKKAWKSPGSNVMHRSF